MTRNIESILEIEEQSKKDADRYPQQGHRLHALPAVAAMHALPFLSGSEIEYANELISDTVIEAFDLGQRPHRETLQIIWQNALTALIRSEYNWQNNILFRTSIIEYAARVCIAFLNGDRVLFYAAIGAYQFILTYECSLSSRTSNQASKALQDVRRAFSDITLHGSKGQSFGWFQMLSKLYHDRRDLNQMLPQQSEIALALDKFESTPDIAEFFLLTRFYGSYVNHQIKDQVLQSPYQSLSTNPCSLIFSLNHRVARKLWDRLRNAGQLSLFDSEIEQYA